MIAIYARKSVFKEDSISVESQIEQCQYEAKGEECVVYADNGYSGKNVDRPDYQRMMNDIRAKKIHKVIVYKLDRISRSILDFSNMMNVFQEMGVSFVSATEHFDTSSPMGRAMLNICIVFAQLERETIQQRVADAYVSRSKKGFYMGGRIPFGYSKVPITIQGVNTAMYEPKPDEAEHIKFIYEMYACPTTTLGDVLKEMIERGINVYNGRTWTTSRLSETLRNPIYTCADKDMYDFFKSHGANIVNDVEDFTGETGLYLFNGGKKKHTSCDLEGCNLVIAPHTPLIDSATWLKCRNKLMSNKQIPIRKPRRFLFASKARCGYCGGVLTLSGSARKDGYVYYVYCSNKLNSRTCHHQLCASKLTDFEGEIIARMKRKIDSLTIQKKTQSKRENAVLQKLYIAKEKVVTQIDNLINSLSEATSTITMNYIENRITELDQQKKDLDAQIVAEQNRRTDSDVAYSKLTNVMDKWGELSFDDKRAVISLLIDNITVFENHMEITWRV